MLPDSDTQRYARQLLLPEIGTRGQALLCAAPARIGQGDVRAQQVASSYLSRAGLPLLAADAVADAGVLLEVAIADGARVEQLAGDPRLHEAAAWLAGSFAAVEAIKHVVQAGHPSELPGGFVLGSETAFGDSLK